MFMKRSIAVLLAIVLAMSLFISCGKADDEDEKLLLAGETDLSESGEGGLTIAYYLHFPDESLIELFEAKTGINVNVVEYKEGAVSSLDTKIMAGDSDIDLFYTLTLDIYKYVRSGYFEDLSSYDGIKERLDSNTFAGFAASYNGKYFGLPVAPSYSITDDWDMSWQDQAFYKYVYRSVNAVDGVYSDENGEELYRVLKNIYHNAEKSEASDEDNERLAIVNCEYFIMNPKSTQKENAVKFLEMLFDKLSGNEEYYTRDKNGNIIAPEYLYPEIEDTEHTHTYLYWNAFPNIISEPLMEAFNSVGNTDGGDEAIRKLSSDAAESVIMRLNE